MIRVFMTVAYVRENLGSGMAVWTFTVKMNFTFDLQIVDNLRRTSPEVKKPIRVVNREAMQFTFSAEITFRRSGSEATTWLSAEFPVLRDPDKFRHRFRKYSDQSRLCYSDAQREPTHISDNASSSPS